MKKDKLPSAPSRGSPNCTRPEKIASPETRIAAFPTFLPDVLLASIKWDLGEGRRRYRKGHALLAEYHFRAAAGLCAMFADKIRAEKSGNVGFSYEQKKD